MFSFDGNYGMCVLASLSISLSSLLISILLKGNLRYFFLNVIRLHRIIKFEDANELNKRRGHENEDFF